MNEVTELTGTTGSIFKIFTYSEDKRFCAGVRPIMEPTMGGVIVGVRVRAESTPVDIPAAFNKPSIISAFPDAKWHKVSKHHASFMGGMQVHSPDQLLNLLKEPKKLVDQILESLGTDFDVSEDKLEMIRDLLTRYYDHEYKTLKTKLEAKKASTVVKGDFGGSDSVH